jgi:twitching motility protein PilT
VESVVQPLEGAGPLDEREIDSLLTTLKLTYHGDVRDPLGARQLTFEVLGVGRVRCFTFQDSRGPGAVFQLALNDNRTGASSDLGIDIQALAIERDGLVLIAGSRVSGKQAVISSFVDLIKHGRRAYVITVQRDVSSADPGDRSLVSRREAPGGLDDMLRTARAAMSENPDVLVLEDVCSGPLMNLAFDAAASGQLVIGGLTAAGAHDAIHRIIELYPPEQARDVQISLARHLRGVVGQVLLPRVGGGNVAARELLLNTKAVAAVLAAGKAEHLGAAMAAGREHGMMSIGDALIDLVRRGVGTAVDAYREAPEPAAFIDELKRAGIDTSFVRRID